MLACYYYRICWKNSLVFSKEWEAIVYEKHLNHAQCLPLSSEPSVQRRSLKKVTMILLLCPCHSGVAEALVVPPSSLGSLFFLKFLAIPYGMQDLSSSLRYQRHALALEGENLITGLPGKCPCGLLMDSSPFPAAGICFSQPKVFPHPPRIEEGRSFQAQI